MADDDDVADYAEEDAFYAPIPFIEPSQKCSAFDLIDGPMGAPAARRGQGPLSQSTNWEMVPPRVMSLVWFSRCMIMHWSNALNGIG